MKIHLTNKVCFIILLTTMVVNNIIKQFSLLGFSEYEAKAYLALLQNFPASAYEVAKTAGIPTSKIYEVLSRLVDKEIVQVSGNTKKKYIPLDADEFLEKQQSNLEKTIGLLKTSLKELQPESAVSYIWNIYKYEELLEKAIRMLGEANTSILISGWPEELAFLESILQEKEAENVQIACINFSSKLVEIGQVFAHPIDRTIYVEKGGRGLVIVTDGQQAMLGTIFADQQVEGAWSKNRGFIMLAEDYIKHDVYIMKIVERFNAQLLEKFGENYEKLRDVFHNEEL
jgi:HTH-type transcriptional regulator, sugar sensing transcriptional regulator